MSTKALQYEFSSEDLEQELTNLKSISHLQDYREAIIEQLAYLMEDDPRFENVDAQPEEVSRSFREDELIAIMMSLDGLVEEVNKAKTDSRIEHLKKAVMP